MEEIQHNLHQCFPSLPQNAFKKIYKARCERLRLLMINGIPADIHWLIEAKVRLVATSSRQLKNICVLSGFRYGKYKEFVQAAIDLEKKLFICAPTANELLDPLQAYKPESDPMTLALDWGTDDDGSNSRKKCKLDLTLHL
ncbi:hypothetical protein WN944_010558 [Citrus x changshan-huyou]|uniref:Uncharacterized protein n=1 Tax=Citrus x changshan-huyou TaxID=2935761 RepID=A0AAP0MUD0_9ROSI